ncbi:hypothetical protein B0H19DRAFT_1369090 [Mycena capillaripes]|nr:hypothetical protein B0H19DRAFT_1369090 [Mycena capillaripes]
MRICTCDSCLPRSNVTLTYVARTRSRSRIHTRVPRPLDRRILIDAPSHTPTIPPRPIFKSTPADVTCAAPVHVPPRFPGGPTAQSHTCTTSIHITTILRSCLLEGFHGVQRQALLNEFRTFFFALSRKKQELQFRPPSRALDMLDLICLLDPRRYYAARPPKL